MFCALVESAACDPSGEAFLTQQQLSVMVGKHRNRITDKILDLSQQGFIRVNRTSKRDRNRYQILWRREYSERLSIPPHDDPGSDDAPESVHGAGLDAPELVPQPALDAPESVHHATDDAPKTVHQNPDDAPKTVHQNMPTCTKTGASDAPKLVPPEKNMGINKQASNNTERSRVLETARSLPPLRAAAAAAKAKPNDDREAIRIQLADALRSRCTRRDECDAAATELIRRVELRAQKPIANLPPFVLEFREMPITSPKFFLANDTLVQFDAYEPSPEFLRAAANKAWEANRAEIKARRQQPMPIDDALAACCDGSLCTPREPGQGDDPRDAWYLGSESERRERYRQIGWFAEQAKQQGQAEITPRELVLANQRYETLQCPDCGREGIVLRVGADGLKHSAWCHCERGVLRQQIEPDAVREREEYTQAIARIQQGKPRPTQVEQPQAPAHRPLISTSRVVQCETCRDAGYSLVHSSASPVGMEVKACTCAAAKAQAWIDAENAKLGLVTQKASRSPQRVAPALALVG